MISIEGTVVAGDGIGRKLGFPTANLAVDTDRIPPHGVYEVLVSSDDFINKLGIASIGTRPTLGGKDTRVEVHVPGFSGQLYGQTLKVSLVRKIRDQAKFDSLEDLKRQMEKDVLELLKIKDNSRRQGTMSRFNQDGNLLGRVVALVLIVAAVGWVAKTWLGEPEQTPVAETAVPAAPAPVARPVVHHHKKALVPATPANPAASAPAVPSSTSSASQAAMSPASSVPASAQQTQALAPQPAGSTSGH